MIERPFELGDLDQPLVELSADEAASLRGGALSAAGDQSLPAIQDGTSNTVTFGEFQIKKQTDKASPVLYGN